MPTALKNALSSSIGTTPVDLYTAPVSTTTTLVALTLANRHAAIVTADISVTDTSTGTTCYILKGVEIAVGGAEVPIGSVQRLVLEETDKITISCNTSGGVDAILTLMERT